MDKQIVSGRINIIGTGNITLGDKHISLWRASHFEYSNEYKPFLSVTYIDSNKRSYTGPIVVNSTEHLLEFIEIIKRNNHN